MPREDYLELHRTRPHDGIHGTNGSAAEFANPATWPAAQKSALHLQKCLTALEKIRGIAGVGPITDIANAALMDKPQSAGGSVIE